MGNMLNDVLAKQFREIANKFEAGTCEISEEQGLAILDMIAHIPMSREDAEVYLNVSKATFTNYLALGKIPKGRKRRGFKELVWYKDELDKAKKKLKKY